MIIIPPPGGDPPMYSPGFDDELPPGTPYEGEEETPEQPPEQPQQIVQPPVDTTFDNGAGGSYFWDMQEIIKKSTTTIKDKK
jgi:hypothetical protein